MVDPFPGVPYSFGALRKTFGPLWIRCDVCRRYARLFFASCATSTIAMADLELERFSQ
jgi:hypothetical protein